MHEAARVSLRIVVSSVEFKMWPSRNCLCAGRDRFFFCGGGLLFGRHCDGLAWGDGGKDVSGTFFWFEGLRRN